MADSQVPSVKQYIWPIHSRFDSIQILMPDSIRDSIPLPSSNSGPVVHTHVALSPSSIIWYQPKDGDALWLGR